MDIKNYELISALKYLASSPYIILSIDKIGINIDRNNLLNSIRSNSFNRNIQKEKIENALNILTGARNASKSIYINTIKALREEEKQLIIDNELLNYSSSANDTSYCDCKKKLILARKEISNDIERLIVISEYLIKDNFNTGIFLANKALNNIESFYFEK